MTTFLKKFRKKHNVNQEFLENYFKPNQDNENRQRIIDFINTTKE